jgi:hypothetical protein
MLRQFIQLRSRIAILSCVDWLGSLSTSSLRTQGPIRRAVDIVSGVSGLVEPMRHCINDRGYARELFFRNHPQWIALLGRAISQAMNYSRMYAVTGDSQVVGGALYTITNINRAYILAKGRTFYSHNPLVNDNRSSDGVVTYTLEAYRQNIRNAVKRGDETEITQLLAGLGTLIVAYSEIQYPRRVDSSWHATLAVGYLNQEIAEMLPHVSAVS